MKKKVNEKKQTFFLPKPFYQNKYLNFNEQIILSYILKFNLKHSKNGCYKTNKFFEFINNRKKNTVSLILKNLKKKQFIFLSKDKKRIYLSEYSKALINIENNKKGNQLFNNSIKLYEDIMINNDLNSIEKIFLCIIQRYNKVYGKCFIKNKTLATMFNITEIYVSRIINSLLKKDKIEIRYTYFKNGMKNQRFITMKIPEHVLDFQI